MAVSLKALDRGEFQAITVSSNDPGVEPGSTPSNFRVKLATPLHFPGAGEQWVMALSFASFGTTGAGLYQIGTSINSLQILGSQSTGTIAIIPCPAASPEFSYVPTSTIQPFYGLNQEDVTEMQVRIEPYNLATPPISSVNPAVVTIVIRRAGAA